MGIRRRRIVCLLSVIALLIFATTGIVGIRHRQEERAIEVFQDLGAVLKFDVEYDADGREIPRKLGAWEQALGSLGFDGPTLTVVDLQSVSVPVDVVPLLPEVRTLRGLFLLHQPVDDRVLRAVADQSNLQLLVIGGNRTRLSGSEFASLTQLPLVTLYVVDCDVSDDNARHVSSITSLRSLNLAGTRITDAVGTRLGDLKRLNYLCVENTRITDNSVDAISTLKELQLLRIGHTAITETGANRLKAALPHCEIDW